MARRAGAAAAVLLVAAHLLTLGSPPYGTFDETHMAAITRSFMETGHFTFGIAPYAVQSEVWAYGPVYFALTALIVRALGVGVVQYRLVSVFAGFALVAIVWRILRARGVSGWRCAVLVAAFAFDPILTLSMHYGRMDTLALLFVFGALLALIGRRGDEPGARIPRGRLLAAGAMIALAILTTPRAALTAAPLAILALRRHTRWFRDGATDLASLAAPVVGLYAVWMVYAFGGPRELLRYYGRLTNFITANFVVSRVQLPLIGVAVATGIVALIRRGRAVLTPVTAAAVIGVILFYLVVREIWGGYSIYILPFYYLLIGEAVRSDRDGRVYPVLLAFLVVANAVAGGRYVVTFAANKGADRAASLARFVGSTVPPGSRLIGGDLHYFAALGFGHQFEYIDEYARDDDREVYQRTVYDYQYLLWPDRLEREQPGLLRLYKSHSTLQLVAEYRDPFEIASFWRRLGIPSFQPLSVRVYRRQDAAAR